MPATNTYTIWIRTGEHNLAGTDSNVHIQFFGSGGQTAPVLLPARDVFAFEAGATDKYVLEVPDIGELARCCIGHDDSEGDSGWFVVDVRVADDDTDREWLFVFNRWIGREESGTLSECADL